MTVPFDPPRESSLPASGGEVGPEPEDFCVDEVAAYEPSGEGDHLYVRIRKRMMTTQAAIRLIARAGGVDARDIGSAGQKDRHAVTTQWLSLPPGTSDPAGWSLPDDLQIEAATRHRNKLRTGHLHGNRFRIRVLGADAERAAAAFEALCDRGLLNVFGPQRFGRGGRNLEKAIRYLTPGSGVRVERFERKMLPSVLQSELFNRYAVARIARGEGVALDGEWVRLADTGKHFQVEDVDDASRRLGERDIVLTGALPGGRMGASTGAAAALEAGAYAPCELPEEVFAGLGREAPGARRDLRVPIEDGSCEVEETGAVVLTFRLPAGSYASMVVREVTGRSWGEALRDGERDGE
jgi:tRNA pseudouridine13 synthase